MTPKEKAQELIDKMTFETHSYNAKHCVLVAIDEILNVASPDEFTCKFYTGDYYSDQDYFIAVKKEIEKL